MCALNWYQSWGSHSLTIWLKLWVVAWCFGERRHICRSPFPLLMAWLSPSNELGLDASHNALIAPLLLIWSTRPWSAKSPGGTWMTLVLSQREKKLFFFLVLKWHPFTVPRSSYKLFQDGGRFEKKNTGAVNNLTFTFCLWLPGDAESKHVHFAWYLHEPARKAGDDSLCHCCAASPALDF